MLRVAVVMRAASSAETEALGSVDRMRQCISSSRKRLDQVADARVQRNHSPGGHQTLVMVPPTNRGKSPQKNNNDQKHQSVYVIYEK